MRYTSPREPAFDTCSTAAKETHFVLELFTKSASTFVGTLKSSCSVSGLMEKKPDGCSNSNRLANDCRVCTEEQYKFVNDRCGLWHTLQLTITHASRGPNAHKDLDISTFSSHFEEQQPDKRKLTT